MLEELRRSLRSLLKSFGFTMVAVGTLALGIGSTTALFSVVNSILLKPLPYHDPDRLVKVPEIKQGEPEATARRPASPPDFGDWLQKSHSFERLAAVQEDVNVPLTSGDEPYRAAAVRVSSSLFPLLGRQPHRGRPFLPSEDRPDAEPVVMLSYAFWQNHFGGDPTLVGKVLTISGKPHTVVGIMPEDFHFPTAKAEIWLPLAMDLAGGSRWARFLSVYGRLRPGTSLAQAQLEMTALAAQLAHDNPGPDTGMSALVVPLKQEIVGDSGRPLWLLLGAVGFVLLIALVNVTNLFLLRTLGRQREIAVCAAFGASRVRILRQFLGESMLLAVIGSGVGLLLAVAGVRLFLALSPEGIPRLAEVAVDPAALALTVALGIVTGLVLGLAPGISAYGPSLSEVLRIGSRGTEGVHRRRLRTVLVAGEIALSVVLLIGACLMMVSFARLFKVNPGFRPEKVLTMQFTLPRSSYPEGAQKAAFFGRVLERVAAVPGVVSDGMINHLPLSGSNTHWNFHLEGQHVEQGKEPQAGYRVADEGYFRTLRIPLVAGRLFRLADHQKGAAVVLVNDTMARRYWPRGDALGKRLRLGDESSTDQPWLTVAGVVGDVRHDGLAVPAAPELFLPYSPDWWDPMNLVVRTSGDPEQAAGSVRAAVWDLDKTLPLYNVKTMDGVLAGSLAKLRLDLVLMAVFAAVAFVLAIVGIYGIMAQSVDLQAPTIAVHMALGADRPAVLRSVLWRGLVLSASGVAAGVAASLALNRTLASLLYGVSASDPAAFAGVAALFLVIAQVAVLIPALRATRVDPMTCLKA
jgi:putative ABC transport system permease protein